MPADDYIKMISLLNRVLSIFDIKENKSQVVEKLDLLDLNLAFLFSDQSVLLFTDLNGIESLPYK